MKTIERLGWVVAGVALTFSLTPFFERVRANAVRSRCQSNLKQIGLAHIQYIRDYDETLPLAHNWETVLQPFLKPPPEVWRCPDQKFAYVYNAHLARINYEQVDKKQQMTLVYEGATARRADTGQSWFPKAHGDGSNVLYMDGHVKWETKAPRFFSPEMANPREWQRKQDAKNRAIIKALQRENLRPRRRLQPH